jgi:hypothetical protein
MLEDKLEANQSRKLHKLVDKWIEHATKGSAKHLELILERLDPVQVDDQRQGVVVFEGITLEIKGTSPVEGAERPRDVDIEVSTDAIDGKTAHPSSESFALDRASESRGESTPQSESATEPPSSDSPS